MLIDSRVLRSFLVIALSLCTSYVHAADRVRVEIEGLGGDLFANVTGSLTLIQQKSHDALTDERIKKLHGKTPAEIREALQPFGYYKPTINAELTLVDNVWVARYVIDPGPALKLISVDVQIHGAGAQDSAFQRALKNLPVTVGATLEHAHYEEAKSALKPFGTRAQVLKQLANYIIERDH